MFSVSRIIRAIIYINLWTNVIFYIVCFFLQLLECIPRAAIWNPWFEGARCVNGKVIRLVSAILNAVSDLAILILPISTVWKLKMRRKKKVALVTVFATGLLYALLILRVIVAECFIDLANRGCAASLVRIVLFATTLDGVYDFTWDSYSMQLWS